MEKASFPEQWLQVLGKVSLDFFVVEMGERRKVLYKGGKAYSYFGYPAEAFVDQIEGSFLDFVLEADQSVVAKAMHEAVQAQADIEVQFHLICFDSSVSLVRINGSYLYSQNKRPVYLFLISDEKPDVVPIDTKLETFTLSFAVGTGSLLETNLQGRIAFLVHEFTNLYEAITIFAARYVHPQDRKVFSVFADRNALTSTVESKGLAFRRTSYNEAFSGYRWALLSYSLQENSSGMVCTLHIKDSDKVGSQLAEKTLQAQLDPLTGVLNRSALESQVQHQVSLCSAMPCLGAFFMLDIDQFKWVNDTYGHDRGDEVLRQVAQAVRGVFRPTDIVSRPGGDEFAVFITGIPSYELALAKAESLCRALRFLKNPEDDLHLSCSVGVSMYPEHGTSFGELYHTSDLALYQAKREGKDRYALYGVHSYPLDKRRPVDREWLFSQMEEEIYLCNVDTYELLFANEALLKRLGLTASTATGYCYEVLHARTTPCEHCKNLYLKQGKTRTRMCLDTKLDVMYLIREKALLLKGERVKLAVSTPFPQGWKEVLVPNVSASLLERIPQV